MKCNKCRRYECACPEVIPAPCTIQSHTREVVYGERAFGINLVSPWNVPQPGGSAVVSVDGAVSVVIGANIWHPDYGYFEISSFDEGRGLLSITNNNLAGNADPGTQVPKCIAFTVSPPPCCDSLITDAGIYLKYDFVAPGIGDCTDIILTGVLGLTDGDALQIGTAQYTIGSINVSTNVVEICNDGEGFVPGTPIISQNSSGEYQYPVVGVPINPCDRSLNTAGIVQVCVDGNQSGLSGAAVGDTLAIINATTGEAGYSSALRLEVADNTADLLTIYNNFGGAYPTPCSDYQYRKASNATVESSLGNHDFNHDTPGPVASDNTHIDITNNSSCRDLSLMYTIDTTVRGSVYGNDAGATVTLRVDVQVSINGGAYDTSNSKTFTMQYLNASSRLRNDISLSQSGAFTIPHGNVGSVDAKCLITWEGVDVDAESGYILTAAGVGQVINLIGIAV